jgi:hypothetical protein
LFQIWTHTRQALSDKISRIAESEVTEQSTSKPEFSINVLTRSSGLPGQSDCVLDLPRVFGTRSRDQSAMVHDNHVLQQKSGWQSDSWIPDAL